MVDIVNCFYKNGYDCSIISGRIVERNIPLNPGIRILKITKYDRSTNIRRIQSWILGSLQILLLCLFKLRGYHLFIVSNPPLAPIIPYFLGNKYSLLIFDVFPDALIEFGKTKRGSIIHKFWTKTNKKVYKKAEHIFTLTEGMKLALLQYVEAEKIKIIPLWTSDGFLKPKSKESNHFAIEHKLSDKFVVMYSGNFGIAHHIETILDLAAKVKDRRISFVIIGGGPAEKKLKAKLQNLNLENCLMLPWQQVSDIPDSLSSADLAIVTLSENASRLGIPSKIYSFMSLGAPILGISGPDSELKKLITSYNIGESFTPNQTDEMVAYLEEMSQNQVLYNIYKTNSLYSAERHSSKNVNLIVKHYV